MVMLIIELMVASVLFGSAIKTIANEHLSSSESVRGRDHARGCDQSQGSRSTRESKLEKFERGLRRADWYTVAYGARLVKSWQAWRMPLLRP